MATGTATTRRLAKIAERLGPTQLLVQWLTAAQEEYSSFSAYAGYVNSTPDPNPICGCSSRWRAGCAAAFPIGASPK
jgi:hypothetical protein